MKWDFAIGNPAYQDQTLGDNKGFAPPIYDKFIDAACEIADKVEMIHPARFLFNAGSTPKAWNEKMLEDSHFKILHYEADAKKVFPNISITGGIAISYHDKGKTFGAIRVFTPFPELNSILHKVVGAKSFSPMEQIVISRTIYRLTNKLHSDYPKAIRQLSSGHAFDMSSNIFDRLPQVFFLECPNDGHEYIKMLGRKNGERIYMYVRRDYIKNVDSLYKYKLVLARADGAAGTVGNPIPARIIGSVIVESPGVGTTESFLSIGAFSDDATANNALKYTKTKFSRALVSILKTTQDITPEKWRYVPLQDFTDKSDINWNASIANIDQQLYKKYGLSQEEIDFIETHVKEMA